MTVNRNVSAEGNSMSTPIFLEIVFQSADFTFGGRDEIEDPLEEALQDAGIGEVTGGGSGMGTANIDVDVFDLEKGVALIRAVLKDIGVAPSTIINQYSPQRVVHHIYE